MSILHAMEGSCVACGAAYRLEIADSLNVERRPALHAMLLERRLHRATCACGQEAFFERPLTYVDLGRGLIAQVFLPGQQVELDVCEGLVDHMVHHALRRPGLPPIVHHLGAHVRARAVFGLEELREKVLCLEHGLDDFVVEILKLELILSAIKLVDDGLETLRLEAVTPAGWLEFTVLRHPHPRAPLPEHLRPQRLAAPLSAYRDLLARRDDLAREQPALATRPWCSLLRERFNPHNWTDEERRAGGPGRTLP